MHDVAELVAQAAVENPDRTAIIEAQGRRLTWSQLDQEVSRGAAGLGDAGIVAGHRVLLVLDNCAEFVTTCRAVSRG